MPCPWPVVADGQRVRFFGCWLSCLVVWLSGCLVCLAVWFVWLSGCLVTCWDAAITQVQNYALPGPHTPHSPRMSTGRAKGTGKELATRREPVPTRLLQRGSSTTAQSKSRGHVARDAKRIGNAVAAQRPTKRQYNVADSSNSKAADAVGCVVRQLAALDCAAQAFAGALEKAEPGTTREAWAWMDSVREDVARRLLYSLCASQKK